MLPIYLMKLPTEPSNEVQKKLKKKKNHSQSPCFGGYRMYVVKRDGRQEPLQFGKITARLKKLSYGLSVEHCDPVIVAQKVCAGLYDGVTTTQLDELATETAAAMTTNHPDYALVGTRNKSNGQINFII